MSQGMLGDLTRFDGDAFGFGGHLYVQDLHTSHHNYKVLFTPLGVSASGCLESLELEVGCKITGHHLEMKFFLEEDWLQPPLTFRTPAELGLKPHDMASLNQFGMGLALAIREIQAQLRPAGIAAVALDEKPELKKFYARLFRSHAKILSEYGYKPRTYLGGQGYALFEQSFAAGIDGQAESA